MGTYQNRAGRTFMLDDQGRWDLCCDCPDCVGMLEDFPVASNPWNYKDADDRIRWVTSGLWYWAVGQSPTTTSANPWLYDYPADGRTLYVAGSNNTLTLSQTNAAGGGILNCILPEVYTSDSFFGDNDDTVIWESYSGAHIKCQVLLSTSPESMFCLGFGTTAVVLDGNGTMYTQTRYGRNSNTVSIDVSDWIDIDILGTPSEIAFDNIVLGGQASGIIPTPSAGIATFGPMACRVTVNDGAGATTTRYWQLGAGNFSFGNGNVRGVLPNETARSIPDDWRDPTNDVASAWPGNDYMQANLLDVYGGDTTAPSVSGTTLIRNLEVRGVKNAYWRVDPPYIGETPPGKQLNDGLILDIQDDTPGFTNDSRDSRVAECEEQVKPILPSANIINYSNYDSTEQSRQPLKITFSGGSMSEPWGTGFSSTWSFTSSTYTSNRQYPNPHSYAFKYYSVDHGTSGNQVATLDALADRGWGDGTSQFNVELVRCFAGVAVGSHIELLTLWTNYVDTGTVQTDDIYVRTKTMWFLDSMDFTSVTVGSPYALNYVESWAQRANPASNPFDMSAFLSTWIPTGLTIEFQTTP